MGEERGRYHLISVKLILIKKIFSVLGRAGCTDHSSQNSNLKKDRHEREPRLWHGIQKQLELTWYGTTVDVIEKTTQIIQKQIQYFKMSHEIGER